MNMPAWLWAIIPSVFTVIVLWFVVRMSTHSDRGERRSKAEVESQERAYFEKKYGANPAKK